MRIVLGSSWRRFTAALYPEGEANMCDENFAEDVKAYQSRVGVTRREFGALSVGAGMAILLPRAEGAVAVTESEVNI